MYIERDFKENKNQEIYDLFLRKEFVFIAGPCAVESKTQIIEIAKKINIKENILLRGSCFKARTSPNSFQGLGSRGLKFLSKARREFGLPTVSEITSACQLSYFNDVDVLQVGARNMQNFELLKALGHSQKPILLKRGFANTIDELLKSAEYITNRGNNKVILCERGIRTFETSTRNTLDISSVPLLKRMCPFPIIVDPSHASGNRELVKPLSLAAAAIGADGIMVEIHDNPAFAKCDGLQAISSLEFIDLVECIKKLLPYKYIGRYF